MPEDEGTDAIETIEMAKYKDLQRKNNRLQKTTKKITEQIEGLRSGQDRTEILLEGLVRLVAADESLKPAVKDLLDTNSTRRSADHTSDELTARLTDLLDDADADWEDTKFDEARKVYNDINEGGNINRASELERLMKDAITPPDERSMDERIAEGVERALHGQNISTQRVDTGSSTVRTSPTSRQDLARMNPREGRDAMIAANKDFLDKLGT